MERDKNKKARPSGHKNELSLTCKDNNMEPKLKSQMSKYRIKLSEGIWLAPHFGTPKNPGKTIKREDAKVFGTIGKAMFGLAMIRITAELHNAAHKIPVSEYPDAKIERI